MISRFKEFTKGISTAYKHLIKLKSYGIKEFGIKGSHVMCLFYISEAENGLNATELCRLCSEDKAAISKALSALEEKGYVQFENYENQKISLQIFSYRKRKIRYIKGVRQDIQRGQPWRRRCFRGGKRYIL